MIKILVQKGANIFFEKAALRDSSPFFIAIRNNFVEAIEVFCDSGVDLSIKSSSGLSPLIYSAKLGMDNLCMYLSLRDKNLE